MMACRLAGAYRDNIGGVEILTNQTGEDTGVVVHFPANFVRGFWAYMTDEMEHVLGLGSGKD